MTKKQNINFPSINIKEQNTMNEEKSRLDSKYSEKSNKRERKSPRCGRCEVHGKYSLLKGHKEDCKYRDCKCPGCQIYLREQRVSADKIFLKRDRDLKKKRKLLPQEVSLSLSLKRNL